MSDAKRTAYDLAQQVDEKMDQLERCKGWSQIVIPEIQKKRDDAQEEINAIGADIRETDYYRGELAMCDEILSMVTKKKKSAANKMAANLNGAVDQ